ncbi:TonB-dependent receptor plug domain-containing protein [Capnocytophaga cynodegmi]|uniref:TonB-dependent receptor n=1 Tax=Capnocytophaga cynodegmi TaxID=28189 RepID=A0A0B7H5D6_9FLAO
MVKVLGRYLLILLGTATLQAQNFPYKIKGKITDENRNIITDVIVEVKGNGKIRAITNEKGFYNLAVPVPKVTLRIYKMGFVEKTVEVSASSNENRVTYLDAILFRNEIELQEVVVTDNPSLVTNSKSAIQKNLNRIPGGVILTDLSALKTQRSQTLKDAIGNEPGVIIQEFFGGNDQPRLNIRGSGIQSNPQSRGVALLQDGIPINFADGSYIIGVLEPQASHLVEVYKGANALQYGSATLGGSDKFCNQKWIQRIAFCC